MADSPTTSEALREQFGPVAESDAAVAALLTEACRVADRLDRLHEIETGKVDWFELMRFRTRTDAGDEITVTIDGVVAESRQQANTLRQLVVELMKVKPVERAALKPVANPLDEVKQRRERRNAG